MKLALVSPLFKNDIEVLAILLIVLALVFKTASSQRPVFKKFYSIVPSILLCYMIPGILNSLGIISGENSGVYKISIEYLLPASLVLLTLSLDLKEIWKLRKKAGLMFITGTIGVLIGGPLAILIASVISPGLVAGQGDQALWRGLATIAGSWSGGSANMLALYSVFKPDTQLFSSMIALDVICAGTWLGILMYGANKADRIDRFLGADSKLVKEIKTKMDSYQRSLLKIPELTDTILIITVGLGVTGLCYLLAGWIVPWISEHAPYLEKFSLTSTFFWIMVLTTACGILLSLTKVRRLEGVGASRIGTLFLYLMIVAVGMKMNVMDLLSNPGLLLIGVIWLGIHATLMFTVARIFKIPFFFVAVGSEANIGGAPTASLVASVFHPSLVPVGVLLSVLGYAIGTYCGYLCSILMQFVSP